MAEENILNISLKEYKAQIEALKGSLLGLEKESDAYKSKVSQIQTMQDKLNTVLSDCKNTNSAVAGSYNALTAELSKLRKQWKSTADEIERSAIGEKMVNINNQLKALDASVGNYQRNVGDYGNQFALAFASLGGSIEGTFSSLQSMVSLLPHLGEAFTSVGSKIAGMMKANPILLAISVAIAAIVAICEKFKSAVSKNSDLQKRWNANLAAFQPIIEMVNKVFDKLAQVIMDCVDWCVEHIPQAFKIFTKYANVMLERDKKLVNAILFFPTVTNKAFASVIKIIGSAVKKIGQGMSSLFSFFGLDEFAKKVDDRLQSIGSSITSFGDKYLGTIDTVKKSVNDFFDNAKSRVDSYVESLSTQMTAARKNAKEQQQIAKEEAALNQKIVQDEIDSINDRIKIKKAQTQAEKDQIRELRIAKNKELAQEKKDLAERKYLAKQEEYTRNGRSMSGAEKAELLQLRLAAKNAGNELLQRNIKMTSSDSNGSSRGTAKETGKKMAKVVADTFNEELQKALGNIKEDAFSTFLQNQITNLTKGANIRAEAAVAIKDYLKIDKGDLRRKLQENSDYVETEMLNAMSDVMTNLIDATEDEIRAVNEKFMSSSWFGIGSFDVHHYFDQLVDFLKEADVDEYVIDKIGKEVIDPTISKIKTKVYDYNKSLAGEIYKILDGMKFDDKAVNNVISSNKRQLMAVGNANFEVLNAIENADKGKYKDIYDILKDQFGFKDNGRIKEFDELTKEQVEVVKSTYKIRAKDLQTAYTQTLINTIRNIGVSTDEAIKEYVGEFKDKWVKALDEAVKVLKDQSELQLQNSIQIQFDNTVMDKSFKSKLKGYVMLMNEYNEAVSDKQDENKMKLLDDEITLRNEKLEALRAEKEQMLENGATELELAEISKEIEEEEASRKQLLQQRETEDFNRQIKNIEKNIKTRQKWVKNIQTSYSNIGSALSTVASIRQDSIQAQLDEGKISEEEAEKQWKSTQSMAIAAATIQTLGTAIGETYSIWTDTSITSFWAKIGLIATQVPATIASLVAQINQIKSTSPSSSSSVSSSGASISSVAVTPILDENQDMNTIQQIKSGNTADLIKDQRVYIVESDIQKSNKRVAVRESNSTF